MTDDLKFISDLQHEFDGKYPASWNKLRQFTKLLISNFDVARNIKSLRSAARAAF